MSVHISIECDGPDDDGTNGGRCDAMMVYGDGDTRAGRPMYAQRDGWQCTTEHGDRRPAPPRRSVTRGEADGRLAHWEDAVVEHIEQSPSIGWWLASVRPLLHVGRPR